jgi:hypothetical protein
VKVPNPLQSLHDEGPEHDLHAHGKLERRGRLPCQDPRSVQDVLRKDEENPGLALEHFRASVATGRTACGMAKQEYKIYVLYKIYTLQVKREHIGQRPPRPLSTAVEELALHM